MIQVIGIGGMPATGKSTLMRALMHKLGKGSPQKAELLRFTAHADAGAMVLGIYGEGKYDGTDRLSMAVMPVAVGVIDIWAAAADMDGWSVLFEGDRLFAGKFLESRERNPNISCHWIQLVSSPERVQERMQGRADTKTGSWLRGRQTKLRGLRTRFTVHEHEHDDLSQTADLSSRLCDLVTGFKQRGALEEVQGR